MSVNAVGNSGYTSYYTGAATAATKPQVNAKDGDSDDATETRAQAAAETKGRLDIKG